MVTPSFFDRINLKSTVSSLFAPPPSFPEFQDSCVQRLKKIWNAVKEIFDELNEPISDLFKPAPFAWKQRDVSALHAARERQKRFLNPLPTTIPSSSEHSPRLAERKVTPIELKQKNKGDKVEKGEEGEPKPYHENTQETVSLTETLEPFDEPFIFTEREDFTKKAQELEQDIEPKKQPNLIMRNFRETSLKFVDLAIDALFDDKIAPKLEELSKTMEEAKEYLKQGALLSLSIGHKAAYNLFEEGEQKAFSFLCTFAKKLPTFLEPLVPQNTLKTSLTQAGHSEACTTHALQWLYQERSTPLSLFASRLDEKIDRSGFRASIEAALSILKTKQIEQLHPTLTKEDLKKNAQKIGDLALDHLIASLENMPYHEAYRYCLTVLYDHSQAILDAEAIRKEAQKNELEAIAARIPAIEEAIAAEKKAIKSRKPASEKAISAEKEAIQKALSEKEKAKKEEEKAIRLAENAAEKAAQETARRLENARTAETLQETPDWKKEYQDLIDYKQKALEIGLTKWLENEKEVAWKEAYLKETKGRESWLKLPGNDESKACLKAKDKEFLEGWLEEIGEATAKHAYCNNKNSQSGRKDWLNQKGKSDEHAFKRAFRNDNTSWLEEVGEAAAKNAYLDDIEGRRVWLDQKGPCTNERAYAQAMQENNAPWFEEIGEAAAKNAYLNNIQGRRAWLQEQKNKETAKELAYSNAMQTDNSAWLDEMGQSAAKQAYKIWPPKAKIPFCHSQIDQVEELFVSNLNESPDYPEKNPDVNQTGLWAKIDEAVDILIKHSKDEEEPSYFEKFADTLLARFLPNQRVENEEEKLFEIDGLIYVFDQIEFPESFRELLQEVKFLQVLHKEFVSESARTKSKEILQKIYHLIAPLEDDLLTYLKNYTRHKVAESIKLFFKEFIYPEKVNQIMGEIAFPELQKVLVDTFSRRMILDQAKEFGLLFYDLYRAENENRQKQTEGLLYNLTKKISPHLKQSKLSDDSLQETLSALIQEINFIVADVLESAPEEERLPEKVQKLLVDNLELKQVYEETPIKTLHSDLIDNLVFKIGQLDNNVEWIVEKIESLLKQPNKIKKWLEKELMASLHDTKTIDYPIEKLTKRIHKNYIIRPENVAKLFEKREPLSPEEIQTNLQREIDKTAQIFHDILMYESEKQTVIKGGLQFLSFVGSFIGVSTPIADLCLKEDSSHLSSVIMRIYNQLINDPLRLQNLTMRMQEKLFAVLAEGSRIAIETGAITPKKVSRLPSLFPSFEEGHH